MPADHELFHAERHALGLLRVGQAGSVLMLEALTAPVARSLATALAAIDPWQRMAIPADDLLRFLLDHDPACHRFAITLGGRLVGVVAVRDPFLHGPYLNLLAVLPDWQGLGIGSAVLAWLEARSRGHRRNLFLCVSTHNPRAAAFYRAHGYVEVGLIEGLALDLSDELLMRKRL